MPYHAPPHAPLCTTPDSDTPEPAQCTHKPPRSPICLVGARRGHQAPNFGDKHAPETLSMRVPRGMRTTSPIQTSSPSVSSHDHQTPQKRQSDNLLPSGALQVLKGATQCRCDDEHTLLTHHPSLQSSASISSPASLPPLPPPPPPPPLPLQ